MSFFYGGLAFLYCCFWLIFIFYCHHFRPDTLDPALLRPGRLDRKVEFGLPDLESRTQIFKIHTRTMNCEREIRFELLARLCPNSTGKAQTWYYSFLVAPLLGRAISMSVFILIGSTNLYWHKHDAVYELWCLAFDWVSYLSLIYLLLDDVVDK